MPKFVVDFDPVAGITFRDARPFQAGENSVARSLAFPPHPGAFWAAVRQVLHPRLGRNFEIAARGFAVVEELTEPPSKKQDRKLPSSREVTYWPVPLDLHREDPAEARLREQQPNPDFIVLAPRRSWPGAATLNRQELHPLWAASDLPTQSLEGNFVVAEIWKLSAWPTRHSLDHK